MKIFYGHPNNYINVTKICYEKLIINNLLIISKYEDFKLNLFSDPMPGLMKHIKILDINGNLKVFNDNDEDIVINIHVIFKKDINIYWNDFNITDICMKKCLKNNVLIYIPKNDQDRINLFGDPYPGLFKKIKIIDKFGIKKYYLDEDEIIFDLNTSFNDKINENNQYNNRELYNNKELYKNINNNRLLIIINSKLPNPNLNKFIKSIIELIEYNIYYKLCIIDNDSDIIYLSDYLLINKEFPNIEIYLIKNKENEYGSWKYCYSIYSDYQFYLCINDKIIFKNNISLDLFNNNELIYNPIFENNLSKGYFTIK